MATFNLGATYTFNTRAAAILGQEIKNAKLISIVTHEVATMFDTIDLKYRQIYPLLPPGTPDSPKLCKYYLFTSESGEKIVLADQWIDMDSIQTVGYIKIRVTLDQANLEDITRLRNAMNALGYSKYIIEQV